MSIFLRLPSGLEVTAHDDEDRVWLYRNIAGEELSLALSPSDLLPLIGLLLEKLDVNTDELHGLLYDH